MYVFSRFLIILHGLNKFYILNTKKKEILTCTFNMLINGSVFLHR